MTREARLRSRWNGVPSPGAVVVALAASVWGTAPLTAQECIFPDNVDWVVDRSCEISGIQIAPRNLSVIDGAVLTIQSSGELILDMRNFRISVDPASRIVVTPGGRIRSNQIGPLLVRRTDGGTFGYFLKRVGGPVLDAINPDLGFHPSSAIKTLYMVEALRQVDNGTLNLATTQLNSCPGGDTDGDNVPDDFTLVAGLGQTCPNSFSQASSGGSGGNCTVTTNTDANCGFQTINYGLGLGICAMMKVSNNPAANAIQEILGAGNPQTGWDNMIDDAGSVIGLSATTFANRMGCGGPKNAQKNNKTTLRDLGRVYEQMTTNPAVLFPTAPPVPFVFQNTNAYNFMYNHVNELNTPGSGVVPPLANEQGGEIGLSTTEINRFLNAVRLVHKAGSNCTKTLCGGTCPKISGNPGAGNCREFVTLAGWVSLPIDGGADTRDYVYGVFFNGVTANSLGADLRDDAGQLLRPVIRDALEDF